jgi:hypothetical protein
MESTDLATLRTPHPRQQQIDMLSANLLRATALDVLRRRQKTLPAALGPQPTARRDS